MSDETNTKDTLTYDQPPLSRIEYLLKKIEEGGGGGGDGRAATQEEINGVINSLHI